MRDVEDAELAVRLVREAATLAAWIRAEGLDVERKTSGSDLVTQADRAAEELVGVGRAQDDRAGVVRGEQGAVRLHRTGDADRLVGAAESLRTAIGSVRFAVYKDDYASAVEELRAALGDDFERVRAEGAALSIDEAVAYATRGRGERKRPSSGWASLTPAELEEERVQPWVDLPLWLPAGTPGRAGFFALDPSRALAAGLHTRPLSDTIRDTHAWSAARDGSGPRIGISLEREADLAARYGQG